MGLQGFEVQGVPGAIPNGTTLPKRVPHGRPVKQTNKPLSDVSIVNAITMNIAKSVMTSLL